MKSIRQKFTIRNIQTKLFILLGLLVIFIVSAISIVIYENQKNILFDQARERAFSLTRTLAYSSVNAILLDEYLTLQLLIDSMNDDEDVEAITIIDRRGNIIASNIPKMRGTRLSDALTQKAILSDTYLLQKDKGNIWDTAVPIYNLDQRIGTARMKFSIDDSYPALIRTIFLIGLIAIIVSLVLSYVLSKSFTRPIHQAIDLANEYGRGNLDASIKTVRDDEIGKLIQSLNLLSDNLKTVIDEKISLENFAMIGEFSSFIMHDLKNPLTGLTMLAEGIDQNIAEDDKLKKYSTEMMVTTQKILNFLKTVLTQSKPVEFDPAPIQLNTVVSEAINGLDMGTVSVKATLDNTIPEIWGDAQLLNRAFANILQNSMEAMGPDGDIKVETYQKNGNIRIAFEDNGPGIPSEKQATIFRPFYTEKKSGHGLGLSMVKKTIVAHNGKIEVASEVGRFTRFTITLPINR